MLEITLKEKKNLEKYFRSMMTVEAAAMKAFDTIERARYFLQNHYQELNFMRIHILEEEKAKLYEFIKLHAKKKKDVRALFVLAKEFEREINSGLKNTSSYLPFEEAKQIVQNELPNVNIQDLEAEIIDGDSSSTN